MKPSIPEGSPDVGVGISSRKPTWPTRIKRRSHSHDASIALIGMHGAGKSTLAVIASTVLKMKLVDTNRCFRTLTGLRPLEYVDQNGKSAYHSKETDLMRRILQKHKRNSIIIVSTSALDHSVNRRLLEEFSQSHPVIHILRDPQELVGYLSKHIDKNSVLKMCSRLVPCCRSLANFEFYVKDFGKQRLPATEYQIPIFLSLKETEHDFLGFLRFITCKPRYKTFLSRPENTEFSRIFILPFIHAEQDLFSIGSLHGVHALGLRFDFASCVASEWTTLLDRISAVYAKLLRRCELPIAFIVEHAFNENLGTLINEEQYFCLLQHAISLGADYCFVDLRATRGCIMDLMMTRAATKIIGVWHHQNNKAQTQNSQSWWGSPECISVCSTAAELGCTLIQISTDATSMDDNFAALSFAQTLRQAERHNGLKLSVFNTGRTGKMSRLLNRTLTPVIGQSNSTQPSKSCISEEYEGLITTKETQDALVYAGVIPRLKFCSFGSVITHSVAPAMHNAAFSVLGLPHRYDVLESVNLSDCVELLRSPDFGGLSCANPHKEAMMALIDHISEHGRAIKAINTIYRRTSPTGATILYGENTDWIGVTSCILNYLSPINTVTRKTTALVIGAGGMARASIYACLRLGVLKIMTWNRTREKAEELAKHFAEISESVKTSQSRRETGGDAKEYHQNRNFLEIAVLDSTQTTKILGESLPPPTIIINALPDGDDGQVSSTFDLPREWFGHSTGGVYIESAYKNEPSTLMNRVAGLASRNWVGVGGKELLSEQAFAQIELWCGTPAPRDVMRRAIL